MPILDPTGSSEEKRYELAQRRLRTLDGARLGLLDNSKLNAPALLADIGERLKKRFAIKSIVVRTKERGFSYPVEDHIADEMVGQCDVVNCRHRQWHRYDRAEAVAARNPAAIAFAGDTSSGGD